jgi:hypothetical protein
LVKIKRQAHMVESYPHSDKDGLLRDLLKVLAGRGIAKKWATSQQPYTDILQECQTLMSDPIYQKEFSIYLKANPIIQETVETMLATFAMAANVKWRDIPMPVQILARRGWHINRWLPTFLIIDGPLGRFLKKQDSPLNTLLRSEHKKYPTLAQARDVFNHDLFRKVRNGVGHWSFIWQEEKEGSQLVMIDWESGETDVTITLLEAEALHLVAFSVIEVFDKEIFSRLNLNVDGI